MSACGGATGFVCPPAAEATEFLNTDLDGLDGCTRILWPPSAEPRVLFGTRILEGLDGCTRIFLAACGGMPAALIFEMDERDLTGTKIQNSRINGKK